MRVSCKWSMSLLRCGKSQTQAVPVDSNHGREGGVLRQAVPSDRIQITEDRVAHEFRPESEDLHSMLIELSISRIVIL